MSTEFILSFRLRGVHHTIVQKAATELRFHATKLGLQPSGIIPLPTKVSRWTILRSPFKHKTAQDNVEVRTHSRIVEIPIEHTKEHYLYRVIEYLRDISPDVQLEVQYRKLYTPEGFVSDGSATPKQLKAFRKNLPSYPSIHPFTNFSKAQEKKSSHEDVPTDVVTKRVNDILAGRKPEAIPSEEISEQTMTKYLHSQQQIKNNIKNSNITWPPVDVDGFVLPLTETEVLQVKSQAQSSDATTTESDNLQSQQSTHTQTQQPKKYDIYSSEYILQDDELNLVSLQQQQLNDVEFADIDENEWADEDEDLDIEEDEETTESSKKN